MSHRTIVIGLWVLLLISALFSLMTGPVAVDLSGVLDDSVASQVFWQLRLPRLMLTLLAGALLAITGAAAQSLFRNPLADPGLIGISAGAALSAGAMMVLLGSSVYLLGGLMLPLAAFAGGVLTTLLVARLSVTLQGVSVTNMLLCGIAINAIALAGLGGLKYLAGDQQLRQLSFWLLGSLNHSRWQDLLVLLVAAVPVLWLLPRYGQKLNLLLLGEQQAGLLGLNVVRCKRLMILLIALGVGAVVALTGIIGFVGLVVPHLVRLLTGPDNRRLLPLSALLGAVLLTVADSVSRLLVSPAELPVGIVTALVGGPFFLLLLTRRKRELNIC
ncbi:iron complex transport system permease protein [Amphritea atlantica]|uniref:Iron complex transport system permease protein n=1 Tax=Amphritea atlantica TaxID=355243 RepID=A0A1H9LFX5_9GAMM|nr:iron ABC transporter permease [Amphritea atlantica]SER10280.1 iron complex transport system permease protein [Amphritea atlantica]